MYWYATESWQTFTIIYHILYVFFTFFHGKYESPTSARCPVWKRHWIARSSLDLLPLYGAWDLGRMVGLDWDVGDRHKGWFGWIEIVFFGDFKWEAGPDIIAWRLGSSGFQFGEEGPSKIAPTVTLKLHAGFLDVEVNALFYIAPCPGCNVLPWKTWLKMSRFPQWQ